MFNDLILGDCFCSYGLRYQYGLFRQVIVDGFQHEQPDYWLNFGNPWEIERVHVTYPVKVCMHLDVFNYMWEYWMFDFIFLFFCNSVLFTKLLFTMFLDGKVLRDGHR